MQCRSQGFVNTAIKQLYNQSKIVHLHYHIVNNENILGIMKYYFNFFAYTV